jgi:D-alanyl-D-alanine carboxypeptidase/Putative peptidoglycan binding domain
MRTLRLGMSGYDVTAWQNFLIGKFHENVVATGTFDSLTVSATIDFQLKNAGLTPDGVVGPMSFARALQLGLAGAVSDNNPTGLNWPIKPSNVSALSDSQRGSIFGDFKFVSAPTPDNKEAIKIIDGWDSTNIVVMTIPQLQSIVGAPHPGHVNCHKLVANQLVALFQAWDDAGLMSRILTWNGCWVPRFKRGSLTSLSNHSWGTAFDINAQWNALGATPAKLHETGCTRELVEIASQHGFFWGAWFGMINGQYGNRCDAMHFECFKLIP